MKNLIGFLCIGGGSCTVIGTVVSLILHITRTLEQYESQAIGIIGGADVPTLSLMLSTVATGCWILLAVGAALIAAGIVLLVKKPKSKSEAVRDHN